MRLGAGEMDRARERKFFVPSFYLFSSLTGIFRDWDTLGIVEYLEGILQRCHCIAIQTKIGQRS